MIIVVGTPSEAPVQRVVEEAERQAVPTLVLAEDEAASWNLRVAASSTGLTARIATPGGDVVLDDATGLYLRIIAPRRPGPALDPLELQRHDAALALVGSWADVTRIRVANRPSAMASNGSKPYQAALIRACGFSVPDTVVTNDPECVRAFQARHRRVIYKSTSGIRSIVHELTATRAAELDRVRNLPTQFQQLLTGVNVRVHVVGTQVHACEIDAGTIDYRYSEDAEAAQMTPVQLPPELVARCRALAAALGLPLAGIDLLRDTDGQWWCFEVNPSPAYSCFEEPTGLPIAASLAAWLAASDVA